MQFFLAQHVLLAPLFFLLIEEMGVPLPVPGDAIVAYVGYGLSKSETVTLWQAFIVAVLAILIGSTILFYFSKRYGQSLIRWFARFVFLKQSRIDHAERLFARYGVWAIIFGRHIPGMRIPITILAASSGVRYRTFIISTFVSTVGWVLFYLNIGSRFGDNFVSLFRHDAGLTVIVFVALVLIVVGFHVYGLWRRKRR
jgi:membrane protein DedA with SNARE-associated domain